MIWHMVITKDNKRRIIQLILYMARHKSFIRSGEDSQDNIRVDVPVAAGIL